MMWTKRRNETEYETCWEGAHGIVVWKSDGEDVYRTERGTFKTLAAAKAEAVRWLNS
jgi:hypothetical protein